METREHGLMITGYIFIRITFLLTMICIIRQFQQLQGKSTQQQKTLL